MLVLSLSWIVPFFALRWQSLPEVEAALFVGTKQNCL
jgi:hypothetical protein